MYGMYVCVRVCMVCVYVCMVYVCVCLKGCPQPHICTVYDRVLGDFPAKTVCTPYIYIWYWPTLVCLHAMHLRQHACV